MYKIVSTLFFVLLINTSFSQSVGYSLTEIEEQKQELIYKMDRIEARNATISKKDIYNRYFQELKFFKALEAKYNTQTFQYPKKDDLNYSSLKRQWITENGKLN